MEYLISPQSPESGSVALRKEKKKEFYFTKMQKETFHFPFNNRPKNFSLSLPSHF